MKIAPVATKSGLRILVVEDSQADFTMIEQELRRLGQTLQCLRQDTQAELSATLEDSRWDAVILNYMVPGKRLEIDMALIKCRLPGVPMILVSGAIGEERVVELLKQGLGDFVLKSHLSRLNSVLERNLQEAEEHRRLQRAEQESRSRDYDLIENSRDLICTHDMAGNLLSVNPAVALNTGYPQEKLLCMNLADLVTRGTLHYLPGYFDEIRNKGKARGLMRIRTASGKTRWWEFDNSLRIEGVVVPVVCGMAHDITDEKHREYWLTTLSRVVEQSPVSIVITDPQGNIKYVNPNFERVTGYTRAEVIGQNPRIIKSGEKSAEEYRQMWAILNTGNIWRGEFHNKRKDGTLFWEQAIISSIVDESGKIISFVEVKEDITERKAALLRASIEQEQIFRNARLIDIGTMASALAHELNQPLSAIANYGAVADQMLAAEVVDRKKLQQIVAFIRNDALRGGSILWSVRDFVRSGESVREVNDINEIVKNLIQLKWISGISSEVVVSTTLEADIPKLWLDRVLIEQVLINLIKNGIEAMYGLENEQQLKIETRLFSEENELQVSVRDFGCGLPDRIALDVLTPFFTTKVNGMGLGLTICKNIIESHGGRIWAIANVDYGTTFLFALPLSRTTRDE